MPEYHKQYSPEFKAKIVAEVLEGKKSQRQIGEQHGLHTTTVNRWVSMMRDKGNLQNPPPSQNEPTPRIESMEQMERDIERRIFYDIVREMSQEVNYWKGIAIAHAQMSAAVNAPIHTSMPPMMTTPLNDETTTDKVAAARFGFPFQRKNKA